MTARRRSITMPAVKALADSCGHAVKTKGFAVANTNVTLGVPNSIPKLTNEVIAKCFARKDRLRTSFI